MTSADDALSLWVVYQNPSDAPGMFVVRRHVGYGPQAGPTSEVMICPEIEPLREELRRRGLVQMSRDPNDVPQVVEVWI